MYMCMYMHMYAYVYSKYLIYMHSIHTNTILGFISHGFKYIYQFLKYFQLSHIDNLISNVKFAPKNAC